MPSACAAIPMRPPFSVSIAILNPRLGSPIRLRPGTRTSWKMISIVEEARIPIVFSRVPSDTPGRVRSTRKAEMPRVFFSGSVEQ